MDTARYTEGMKNLAAVDGQSGGAVLRALEDIAPDLARYIVEFAFGDIYARPDLSMAEREMITLASLLTAGGCEPQLTVHINGALNTGIKPEKVIGIFLQCIPYTGFPRVLNAVSAAQKVFRERSIL